MLDALARPSLRNSRRRDSNRVLSKLATDGSASPASLPRAAKADYPRACPTRISRPGKAPVSRPFSTMISPETMVAR